jgi:hypothetical protein
MIFLAFVLFIAFPLEASAVSPFSVLMMCSSLLFLSPRVVKFNPSLRKSLGERLWVLPFHQDRKS